MAVTPDIISSPSNPLVKHVKSLALKKNRDETGLFLVEGARHVADALDAGLEIDTLLYVGALQHEFRNIKARKVEVTGDILSKMTNRDNAQSVLGLFKQRTANISTISAGLWVALEQVRDPGNLGTIIRTADAVGAMGILLIGNTCDPFSAEAIRATMGSFARIKTATASVDEFLQWKKTYKGRVVGTHLNTDIDYRAADYTLPLMLVMGSESNGLSQAVSDACDQLVRIPMQGGTESLNLAVSTGVMLYEVCRSRL